MSAKQFKRDKMAREYARRHLRTDPGIRDVFFLPAGAPDREIRLIEINDSIVERERDPLEPLDLGVAIDGQNPHTVVVLDASPSQWEKIKRKSIPLPKGWSLDGALSFSRKEA